MLTHPHRHNNLGNRCRYWKAVLQTPLPNKSLHRKISHSLLETQREKSSIQLRDVQIEMMVSLIMRHLGTKRMISKVKHCQYHKGGRPVRNRRRRDSKSALKNLRQLHKLRNRESLRQSRVERQEESKWKRRNEKKNLLNRDKKKERLVKRKPKLKKKKK